MAFTRAHLYSVGERQLSNYAHALGHPARIRILRQLFTHGKCQVEQLRVLHPLSFATLSQHLKILRMAGLIICQERFPYTIYSFNKGNIKKLKKEFGDLFNLL